MKYPPILIGVCIVSFFLSGCVERYERQDGCHLDKIPIYGDVVKVETIMQTTMPLTELFVNAFDPEQCVSPYAGNVSIEFDRHGNIKHTTGYGIDGTVLFETKRFFSDNEGTSAPAVFVGPDADQKIDRTTTESSKDGKVISVKYYDGDQLVWNTKATYNPDGTINTIIKDYCLLEIPITDEFKLSYSDTMIYRYTLFDENNNWIEAEVTYKGVFLQRNNFFFKIKRQITYWDDKPKPRLIDELQKYNNIGKQSTSSFEKIDLGGRGSMLIPSYMTPQSQDIIQKVQDQVKQTCNSPGCSLFNLKYKQLDAYASLSAEVSYDESFAELLLNLPVFDEELDALLEEQFAAGLVNAGTHILKWYPYESVMVSGKEAMRIRYYRYGIGSPIPVYCESLMIPLPDGNVMNLIYSFQSNQYNRFHTDFDNSIKSIEFNW